MTCYHTQLIQNETKVPNGPPRSHGILMFVCLNKYSKQCCDVKTLVLIVLVNYQNKDMKSMKLLIPSHFIS